MKRILVVILLSMSLNLYSKDTIYWWQLYISENSTPIQPISDLDSISDYKIKTTLTDYECSITDYKKSQDAEVRRILCVNLKSNDQFSTLVMCTKNKPSKSSILNLISSGKNLIIQLSCWPNKKK